MSLKPTHQYSFGGFALATRVIPKLNQILYAAHNCEENERNFFPNDNAKLCDNYYMFHVNFLQEMIEAEIKQNNKKVSNGINATYLSILIAEYVATDKYNYCECIQCGMCIEWKNSTQSIFYGDHDTFDEFIEQDIPGAMDDDEDNWEVIYYDTEKKQTNVLLYFFGGIPDYQELYWWIGITSGGQSISLNRINDAALKEFRKLFAACNLRGPQLKLDTLRGPVCTMECFYATIFSMKSSTAIGAKMVEEYLLYFAKEKVTIPYVIKLLIGKYVYGIW